MKHCQIRSIRILSLLLFAGILLPVASAAPVGWTNRHLLDESGRHLIPGGFVVLENIDYTPGDFRRMIRMGANFQVIRMPLGRIGGLPGTEPHFPTLNRFDAMVRMGRDAGLRTVFKLVVYGQPFGEKQWDALWHNTDGSQGTLKVAWQRIWIRYKDEPSVFGYDLVNEPHRGFDKDYDKCQRECLLPLLRELTDAMHQISPEKWTFYQPLLRKAEDQWAPGKNPVVTIEEPFDRPRAIFAPHLYQMDPAVIAPMLEDFERQATISNVPLLLGEWGSPTRANTDGNPEQEARYTRIYRHTVSELDRRSIGGIKAWFCGARKPIPVKGTNNWMTWSIFSDRSPAGKVERKYITDVIARPRPLVVAGRLDRYGNDFPARKFEMSVKTNPALGGTEVFVPAERSYPKGFQVELSSGLKLAHDPVRDRLQVLEAATTTDRTQAQLVRWDDDRQRLMIGKWVGAPTSLTVKILPTSRD